MKQVYFALAVFLSTSMPLLAQVTNSLDTFKGKYEQACKQIDDSREQQKQAALAGYSNALAAAMVVLKKKGDIDNFLSVQEELKRFVTERSVSSSNTLNTMISGASAAYRTVEQKSDDERAARMATLLKQYCQALEKQIKDFMAQDKFDEAKQVKTELDRVKAAAPTVLPAPVMSADAVATSGAVPMLPVNDKLPAEVSEQPQAGVKPLSANTSGADTSSRPQSIPANAATFNGHHYLIVQGRLSWFQAKVACNKAGGHLVIITSNEENEFVKSRGCGDYWIGLADEYKTGNWKWVDGSDVLYADWHRGQAESKLPYVRFGKGGHWAWEKNSEKNSGYICEWDDVALPAQAVSPMLPAVAESKASQTLRFRSGWEKVQLSGGSFVLKEMKTLLSSCGSPAIDLSRRSDITVYEGVGYMTPLEEVVKKLGILKVSSAHEISNPAFPEGAKYYKYDVRIEEFNKLLLVTDVNDNVIAVQLVDEAPKKRRMKDHSVEKNISDIVQTRSKGNGRWAVAQTVQPGGITTIDLEVVDNRNQPKEFCRCYLPEPIANIMQFVIAQQLDKNSVKDIRLPQDEKAVKNELVRIQSETAIIPSKTEPQATTPPSLAPGVEFQAALKTARSGMDRTARGDALEYLLDKHYTNQWVQSLIMQRLDDQNVFHGERDVIIKYMVINNEVPSPSIIVLFRRIVGERWRGVPGERLSALLYLVRKAPADPTVIALCLTVIDDKWREDRERRTAASCLLTCGDEAIKQKLKLKYPKEQWRTEREINEVMNSK